MNKKENFKFKRLVKNRKTSEYIPNISNTLASNKKENPSGCFLNFICNVGNKSFSLTTAKSQNSIKTLIKA